MAIRVAHSRATGSKGESGGRGQRHEPKAQTPAARSRGRRSRLALSPGPPARAAHLERSRGRSASASSDGQRGDDLVQRRRGLDLPSGRGPRAEAAPCRRRVQGGLPRRAPRRSAHSARAARALSSRAGRGQRRGAHLAAVARGAVRPHSARRVPARCELARGPGPFSPSRLVSLALSPAALARASLAPLSGVALSSASQRAPLSTRPAPARARSSPRAARTSTTRPTPTRRPTSQRAAGRRLPRRGRRPPADGEQLLALLGAPTSSARARRTRRPRSATRPLRALLERGRADPDARDVVRLDARVHRVGAGPLRVRRAARAPRRRARHARAQRRDRLVRRVRQRPRACRAAAALRDRARAAAPRRRRRAARAAGRADVGRREHRLRESRKDVARCGSTPLWVAAHEGHADCVALLLAARGRAPRRRRHDAARGRRARRPRRDRGPARRARRAPLRLPKIDDTAARRRAVRADAPEVEADEALHAYLRREVAEAANGRGGKKSAAQATEGDVPTFSF